VNLFPVIALVCSAGGLDALTRVLSPLPADLPAAVLVLQHMEPDRANELAAILDQRTAPPVAAAGSHVRSPRGSVRRVAASRSDRRSGDAWHGIGVRLDSPA
jgi:two-component system chemotaxis response regulator CheB